MSNATYQVILSTDGKHTVIVTSDDSEEIKEATAWAQATYEQIAGRYGLKGDQRPLGNDATQQERVAAPLCAVHRVPMVWIEKSKNGPFWSCHEKDAQGNWCSFRPAKAKMGAALV